MFVLALLIACGTATKAVDSAAADTSTTDTSTNGDTGAACSVLNSGTDWAWLGECPQMRTPMDLVVTGCSLAIDYDADGGMTMGMPYAGTVSGSTVTFDAGDSVTGCTGTVVSADRIEGSCDGGCTYTLRR